MPAFSDRINLSSPPTRRRILFAKLGSFSHVNEQLLAQIHEKFPHHEVITFDVKDYIKQKPGTMALNTLLEMLKFGPSVILSKSERAAFFFRTAFMFRRLSAAIKEMFSEEADSFDFVLQTQAFFNAALPRRPLVIYTDYTVASSLEHELADEPRPWPSKAFLALESALYQRADRILVTAGHVKRTLVSYYRCDPERIRPIMNGANVGVLPAETVLQRYAAGRILFVGIEWERKGGPTLLEAFERIAPRFPHATLTILGCAPSVSHPQVRTLGQVPRSELADHFLRSSIFCLPSRIEPSAAASIEAMAFKLPVVATNVGGFPEIVQNGETGILVPPRDPDALADALCALLDDPARARTMGLAGYERSRLFTWDEVGNRFFAETKNFTERQLAT
jgi:glycosyltransferase involved in cell wall biosynthesis